MTVYLCFLSSLTWGSYSQEKPKADVNVVQVDALHRLNKSGSFIFGAEYAVDECIKLKARRQHFLPPVLCVGYHMHTLLDQGGCLFEVPVCDIKLF